MIYLPGSNSAFIHLPRTGGTFLCNLLDSLEVDYERRHPIHGDLARIKDWKMRGLFFFTFVRHPASWLQSYWRHRMTIGWGGDLSISHDCIDEDFNGFAEKVATNFPGFVSELFSRYVGTCRVWVGKYETLVQDIPILFAALGIDTTESIVSQRPRINESSSELVQRSEYLPKVYDLVCESERGVIERFGYDKDNS